MECSTAFWDAVFVFRELLLMQLSHQHFQKISLDGQRQIHFFFFCNCHRWRYAQEVLFFYKLLRCLSATGKGAIRMKSVVGKHFQHYASKLRSKTLIRTILMRKATKNIVPRLRQAHKHYKYDRRELADKLALNGMYSNRRSTARYTVI